MTERVVVVGGGIGGLCTALALGRAGHPVTVLEQDPLPATADAEEAFAAERRGAPQVHQTHGFLARLVVELRDRFPDVLDALRAVGCTTMPTTASLGEPQPGDEDLAVLIVRRTTIEWVLRTAVLAQPGVEIRTGVHVTGLSASSPNGTVPVVDGVVLDDGSIVPSDIVVVANGRRSPLPAWLAAVGVDVPEVIAESGLMYVSRWYRLPDGLDIALDPKLGGDLGFVKYLAVPGDARTLSVTLAVRTKDTELRNALDDPDRFDEACRILPGPDHFFAGGPLEPLGGVRLMGGLLNRKRTFVDGDGRPTVLGLHAVGDAHTCTNPLYGRGCSLALVQAVLLADACAAHPGDAAERAAAYEAASAREVLPWFDVSVQMDKAGADPVGLGGLGPADGDTDGDTDGETDGDGADPTSGPARTIGAIFVAAATDPVIGRGIVRFWNLLATPAALMADTEFVARVAAVVAEPEKYPLPPREGPSRTALLESLAALATPSIGG